MSPFLPIDLRSDTVTRPTPAMRQAMAAAEVGDDVFGDDPTVLALEARVAELAGKEAAVYVPSGTMGNQLAVHCLTHPGELVLLEAESHIFLYEQAGISANSGCIAQTFRADRGVMRVADVAAPLRDDADEHVAKPTLVCLENTHNVAGGVVVPLEGMREVAAAARARGMRVHLDGARLWNASVATGIPIADWAAPVDTLMMCFSKGLGAPVGSTLAGPRDVLHHARRVRKRWGGGMRQVGILAAGCLHALDHHVARLADDHARARRLAAGFAQPGVTIVAPDTNIVMATLAPPLDPDRVLAELEARGVRMCAYGAGRVRAIVHLDVDDAAIERAIAVFRDVVAAHAAPAATARERA